MGNYCGGGERQEKTVSNEQEMLVTRLHDENIRLKCKLMTKMMESRVSQKKIAEFVEKLLQDPDVNQGLVPDAIERRLYNKMLVTLLNIVKQTTSNISIEVLGHVVTVNMQPIEESKTN